MYIFFRVKFLLWNIGINIIATSIFHNTITIIVVLSFSNLCLQNSIISKLKQCLVGKAVNKIPHLFSTSNPISVLS